MKIEIFPDEYDVREVIQYYSMPHDAVRRFSQGLGILCAARGKEHIASFMQNLILECRDYRELQTLALKGGAGNSISGFTLLSVDWMAEGTAGLFTDIVEHRQKQLKQLAEDKSLLERPHFEGLNSAAERISGRLEYQRISPGKVVLLNKVPESVEFFIDPIGDRLWQVTCFPDTNTDVQVMADIFSRMASGAYKTKTPTLEPLEVPKRIEFYDALLLTELKDWRFEEVIGITVRQAEERDSSLDIEKGNENQYEDNEYGLSKDQPTQSDLRGIKQAILEGRGLRTNSFVKACEKQGFYFTSMTIQYRHNREPELMNLTVRFKLNPLMFEIVLEDTFLIQALEQLEPHTFDWQRQREILCTFWSICNRIINQLTGGSGSDIYQPFLPKSN